jgi:hypothetical protein
MKDKPSKEILNYVQYNTSLYKVDFQNYGVYCHIKGEFIYIGAKYKCLRLLTSWGF